MAQIIIRKTADIIVVILYNEFSNTKFMMQNFIIKLIYKYTLQIILERYIFGKPRKMVIKFDVKAVYEMEQILKIENCAKN